MKTISQHRQAIRLQIRKKRQNLTALEQAQAEQLITQKALSLVAKRKAHNIALFLSFDGEVSTKLLIESLWQQGKKVYVPLLHPFTKGHLLFINYRPDSLMKRNKMGISEPVLNVNDVIPIDDLDIIFTPLVAFDKYANRLGMGGGFYDRTLQHWQQKNFLPVGLAHACQQVDELPIESWDVPLYDIISV
ncbi:5-formyltetrahydrofolate cyclo-ligase [Pasteurella bettyae]|mgnify:CR=1 FL=1|uniref:5-formyltetrahydrofolate cyclo-ligase n=1 Tax=Pasteurella bettyae TaxID=752 RepID=UPI003D2E15D1